MRNKKIKKRSFVVVVATAAAALAGLAPSGQNNSGRIWVAAAAASSLVRFYIDEDWSGVFSLLLHTRPDIGFHAGCPFTRHCSAFLTKGPGGNTAPLFVYNV